MTDLNGTFTGAETHAYSFNDSLDLNVTFAADSDAGAGNASMMSGQMEPMHTVIPMTILYAVTFLLSAVGNTVTCVVIVYNRYMHTATNYYLFSMAVSDLLLLVTGLPFELYAFWAPSQPYVFGETFCLGRGLCAETSTNASILTIVFFTVERYMAICHPLLQQTMSNLPRTVRNIALIWVVALLCACFPAAKFGIKYKTDDHGNILEETATCNVVRRLFPHVFEVTTIMFFVVPMLLITLLYVLIGLRLRRSSRSRHLSRSSVHGGSSGGVGAIAARRAVIKMLVAVVVAFFVCWAPFHAQRLLAIYAPENPSVFLSGTMQGLHHVSGVLYFVSTCVNPILYHIMSAKFRQAVRDTFGKTCQRICCRSDGGAEKIHEHSATATTGEPLLARHGTTVTKV